jgi:hypothetical protein
MIRVTVTQIHDVYILGHALKKISKIWFEFIKVRVTLPCHNPSGPGFTSGSVHVGFVAEKVAVGQVSLRFLRISPVSIISPCVSILMYHLGNEQHARWWPQFKDSLIPLT